MTCTAIEIAGVYAKVTAILNRWRTQRQEAAILIAGVQQRLKSLAIQRAGIEIAGVCEDNSDSESLAYTKATSSDYDRWSTTGIEIVGNSESSD